MQKYEKQYIKEFTQILKKAEPNRIPGKAVSAETVSKYVDVFNDSSKCICMIEKCSLDEFLEMPLRKKEALYKAWHSRSFILQMSDVWNEADRCADMYSKGLDISAQVEVFMDACDISLADPKLSAGAFLSFERHSGNY